MKVFPTHRSTCAIAEPLEPRQLLAGATQNIGTLDGRFFRQRTVLGSDIDVYNFSMRRAGTVQIQLSRLIGTGKMTFRSANGTLIQTTSPSTNDQRITFNALGAGDFKLSVQADQAQFAPAVAYTVAIATDFAGGGRFSGSLDLRTDLARNLGRLSDEAIVTASDFIGFLDTSNHTSADQIDTYRFDAPVFGSMNFSLAGVRSDTADSGAKVELVMTLYQDSNNDGRLSGSEAFIPVRTTPTSAGAMLGNIPAGRYFMVVAPPAQPSVNTTLGGSNYTLRLGYTHTDIGLNTLETARTRTLSATPFIVNDLMNSLDTNDTHRFTIDNTTPGPFNFTADLTGLTTGDFDLQLIQDKNSNGRVDILNGEIIAFASNNGPRNERLSKVLNQAGTYFLRVARIFGEDSYRLAMTSVSTDTAKNSLSLARNLGTLATTQTLSEFVGSIDHFDFYRFTTQVPGQLKVAMNAVSPNASVQVIQDANNDSSIAVNEVLASLSGERVLDGVVLPVAGSYFLRVRADDTDFNYTSTITFSRQTPFGGTPIQISNTSTTKIEAEKFDLGADGVAFHDSDSTNAGGALRTDVGVDIKPTADQQSAGDAGGAFRVTDTSAGEFLEYTINVAQTAVYDFNFRLSGKGDNAKFHIEVDGVNVSGPQTVPNTNSFDAMTDLAVQRINLTKGPHVLRLAFDSGASNGQVGFAGSYNFFTVGPTTSAGVFAVRPSNSSVNAGSSRMIEVDWIVPAGGWRTLKDIDLRLRDELKRTVLRVRFDESTNSFRLYDPATRKFGSSVKAGSNAILESKFAKVRIANSTFKANGSTDPKVTLLFDVVFKNNLAGKTLTIEASASDDFGGFDHFAVGGKIRVRS